MTTHYLDISGALKPMDHIGAHDPQRVPLTLLREDPPLYRVNENDMDIEVVRRQRRRMINYWTLQGYGEEVVAELNQYGMCVNGCALPAGVQIVEAE